MRQRHDHDAHVLRAMAVACLAMALVLIVPSTLVALGWAKTGYLLFAVLVFLWPVLALLGLALRRARRC
jgi:hypothetical protein